MRISEKSIRKFWSKIDRVGLNDCWNWTASRTSEGYGHVRIDGQMEMSHRVAWRLTWGEISIGMFVCHHCDNPCCCNPTHLFIGTQLDNMRDASKKGRLPGGGCRKLNDSQLNIVRRLIEFGTIRLSDIGRIFDVDRTVISNIKRGLHYKKRGTAGRSRGKISIVQ